MQTQTPGSDLRPGLVVNDRVRLESRIGTGADAEVWRGTQLRVGTSVAVKIPTPAGRGHAAEGLIGRLLREATLPMRVDSQHVVRVLECALSREVGPYIVMDLVPGRDLFEHLRLFGPLATCDAATVLAQLCDALTALHAAGVFHGDVKPENIVLSFERGRPHATLIDFGIAGDGREIDRGEAMMGVWGTPAYLSPERLEGSVGADAQGDLWSLAVVGYQCLAGRVPFDDRSLASMQAAILSQALTPPGAGRKDVPPRFDAWFRKALSCSRSRRFSSAPEMRDALLGACAVRPASTL